MKRKILLSVAVCLSLYSVAQDTSKTKQGDTVRIGNIVIIKNAGKSDKKGDRSVEISMGRDKETRKKRSNVSTNWWIVDLGFSNYDDQTNYGAAGNYLVNRPGHPSIGAGDFKVKNGKSINVNIWFFMQRLNLIKHHVNLKYGVGLELNNYRYKSSSPLTYREGGSIPYSAGGISNQAFVFRDSISFSKNKLAADYLTVPIMLNFSTNPNSGKRGLSLSAGVSAGYLYSQRNKQISDERGKQKGKGDYDLERFKLSYVAELGLGPIRLYGSYSPKNMYTRGLDMRPYTLGFRLSNW